ncbi:MAG TPA: UDP-N-acetylmuramoyl-tripeptide--D-alanyl-D-alanine ligase [Gemmatimonas aurantiaca]|uniref:UDP-N-acetylmuramoyl-tripeptide--D-alanyl-D-alanine ligase n=2 Tax=Gemmatimonas aurantiaca TaxID=173480 RepID=C1A8A6_GEMAT|nr:UDP-N-acetylmuramoyl-tripeptide--D-alanyl-D-alanine ligase [Gemmatimonas aurantiaca]BAH38466.1 UDP-N-acetylmuramoyl-tripeptide--D-alanyl-D-alanine ligase [Gemmatimonas aurantiaca T-27]HCT56207.1 UDP-N-acetylmuramoyl-tripeptide--D-alanyl-D-alanine ligase [Gemmatimonas aurantiaca]
MSAFTMAGTAFAAVPAIAPAEAHAYWTFERVAAALGTGPSMPQPLAGISTDTRRIARGDVFVALRGDRFDAHDFLATAKDAGAAAFVVSDATRAVGLGVPTYVVPDTLIALGQLAHTWRTVWGRHVIAVAGSNGKTSTKELLKAALSGTFEVHATTGNLNNLIGVPLTLLAIPPHADIAVVELGTNAPGEVATLRAMSAPDVAVLTSIGEEHLEGLGDLAGVLREECDVFPGVRLAIIPVAHPEVSPMASERAEAVVTAGLTDADVAPEQWGLDDEGRPWFDVDGVHFTLPLRGAHQAANAMLAVAAARACGVPLESAAAGMAAMPVPNMRGVWETIGQTTVINDAYNANPPSMRAALALLDRVGEGRQRVAFLGTMRELGAQADVQHDDIARAALVSSADVIVGVGAFGDAFRRVAPDAINAASGRVIVADEPESAWTAAAPRVNRNAVILLKASRGVRLERLLPQLTTWATT